MQTGVPMVPSETRSFTGVLSALRRAAHGEDLSVQDMLAEIGDRSFATALLVPAVVLVSPVSGIPGTPTIGAVIVILIVAQWLAGRDHLWLPDFVMRRRLRSDRLRRALAWFDGPAAFLDRHTVPRLGALTTGPLALLPLVTVLAIAATWPFLELLPFVTTVGAFAVSLFAFGLMTRDGVYVVLGYAFVGALAALAAGIV
jgi:hypothetical protein